MRDRAFGEEMGRKLTNAAYWGALVCIGKHASSEENAPAEADLLCRRIKSIISDQFNLPQSTISLRAQGQLFSRQ